ncbi:hypothetical protein [uncultured Aquimarina sp.]|uniref:hypothetical protein n=1 Tax=uncultured Aquimarina sp. TaxID=575652 RepID=UPI00261B9D06|nr:hypothetical protein [uncultured Aquimarina sp.]
MKTLKILSILCFTVLFVTCDSDDDSAPIVTADLEATSITFSIIKDTDLAGTATIKGIITNIGDADFNSSIGQQTINLYQRNLGASAPGDLVETINFVNIAAGDSLAIRYTRPWNASSPAEGEFPPEYRIVLDYDPDIFIDGNDNNDDVDLTNNELTVSGSGINDLFRN